jgi:glycosyltransferase involved in cell wall biosynthesis
VFIVNGDEQSAMAQRARAFAEHLRDRFEIQLAYRTGNKLGALLRFFRLLRSTRPRITYVFDMAYSGVLGAWLYRCCHRNLLIIETGDAIYELMRSSGNRSPLGLWLTRRLEKFSLRIADRIVVRGHYHQEWLQQRGVSSDVIPDGVDTDQFAHVDGRQLRREHQLDGALTIGLVGSSVWSEKLRMCYGWELVETIRLLKDHPVKGVVIGSGSGIPRLEALCRQYGIAEKMLFLGHVPYEQLPSYLGLIDICLSTQSNDIVGQVRTTGKLPLYLAAGRYVLASKVGEAARVLPSEMVVDYDGVKDESYPRKLKERIEWIAHDPSRLKLGEHNVALAKEHFDYKILAERLTRVLDTAVKDGC